MSDNLDPSKPWRPNPDPVGPPDEDDLFQPDFSSEEAAWDGEADSSKTAVPEMDSSDSREKLLATGTILLLVLGLVATGLYGGNHGPRIGTGVVLLWFGLLLSVTRWNRRWYCRSGGGVALLVGAVACWYLVPTTGGVSLLEAQSRLDAVRNLTPGDVAGFEAGKASRRELVQEYPNLKTEVAAAEKVWVHRTAALEVAESDRLRSRDPSAALDRLAKTLTTLQLSEHSGSVQSDLRQARRRAVESRLDRAETLLENLLKNRQFAHFHQTAAATLQEVRPVAAEVGLAEVLETRLRRLMEAAVRRQADIAHETLTTLYEQKLYTKVAAEGRRLQGELTPLATPLRQEKYVADAIRPLREKAFQAQLNDFAVKLNALHRGGELEAIPKDAGLAADELRDEGKELGLEALIDKKFLPFREKALLDRMTVARKALEAIFAKKEYVAVAARGKKLQDALEGEARAVGAEMKLRTTLGDVRRKALQARLDIAREGVRDLVAKERYQAVGEAGEKAVKEMSAEAAAIDGSAELNRFRDSCKVFADLAKKANVEDKK